MRKTWLLLVIIVCALFVSCGAEQGTTGSLLVSIAGFGQKTIEPMEADFTVDHYTVSGSLKGTTDSFNARSFTGGMVSIDSLFAGTWSVTVDGYNATGTKVATKTQDVVIEANQTNTASFQVEYLSEGTGSLSYTISWPENLDCAAKYIKAYLLKSGANDILLAEGAPEADSHTFTVEKSNLDPGQYDGIKVLFFATASPKSDTEALAVKNDANVAVVYPSLTSVGTMTLQEDSILAVAIVPPDDWDGFWYRTVSYKFTAVTTVTSPTYQWYLDGTAVVGETGSSYTKMFDTTTNVDGLSHTLMVKVTSGGRTFTSNTISYTVKKALLQFALDGGSGTFDDVEYNGSYFSIPSTIPTKDGYAFMGWKRADAGTRIDQHWDLTSWYAPAGCYTVQAIWEPLSMKTSTETKTVLRGETGEMTWPTTIDGYTFVGWYPTATAAPTDLTASELFTTAKTEDTTYYPWYRNTSSIFFEDDDTDGNGKKITYYDLFRVLELPASTTETEAYVSIQNKNKLVYAKVLPRVFNNGTGIDFYWLTSLREITIDDQVTSLSISLGYLSQLNHLVIPSSIQSASYVSVYGCGSPFTITIMKKSRESDEDALLRTFGGKAPSGCTVEYKEQQ